MQRLVNLLVRRLNALEHFFNFHNNTYKVWRSVDITIFIDCHLKHLAEWKGYLTDMGLTGLGKGSFYYPPLTSALIPDSVTVSHSCPFVKSNLLALRPQLLLSIPTLCNFKLSCNKIPCFLVIPSSGISISVSDSRASNHQLLTSLSFVPTAAGNSCDHSPGCSDLQEGFQMEDTACIYQQSIQTKLQRDKSRAYEKVCHSAKAVHFFLLPLSEIERVKGRVLQAGATMGYKWSEYYCVQGSYTDLIYGSWESGQLTCLLFCFCFALENTKWKCLAIFCDGKKKVCHTNFCMKNFSFFSNGSVHHFQIYLPTSDFFSPF